MVDCRPLTAHPVAMATKPNQNGTGTASNGRQPHHQKFYPIYPVLPPTVLIYSSYCRAFSYTKEKRKRRGGGIHDIDGAWAVGDRALPQRVQSR